LDTEVVVGGDGSIAVHPPRHRKNEKPYTEAYKVSKDPPTVKKGKRKKAQKSAEEQYMAMIEQVPTPFFISFAGSNYFKNN